MAVFDMKRPQTSGGYGRPMNSKAKGYSNYTRPHEPAGQPWLSAQNSNSASVLKPIGNPKPAPPPAGELQPFPGNDPYRFPSMQNYPQREENPRYVSQTRQQEFQRQMQPNVSSNQPPPQTIQPAGQRLGGMASFGQQTTQPTGPRLGGTLTQPPQQSVQPIGQRLGGQMSMGGGALEQALARRQGSTQGQATNNLSVLLGMLR